MNRLITKLLIAVLLFTVHYAFSQGIWKTYTTANGLAGNFVNCINQDKLGNYWFGVDWGGLSKLDTNGVWTNYFTDTTSSILDIEIDSINNKWLILFRSKKAWVVKFNDSTFTYYSPTGHPQYEPRPSCLGQDSSGHIWCGTTQIDTYWFDGAAWHFFYVPGLWEAYDNVREIRTDRHSKLYFAHYRGVSTIDKYIFYGGWVWDLAFDKQDRLWFGSTTKPRGLWMYDGNQWYQWTKDNGLLNPYSNVLDVAVDSNNNIWISNDDGQHLGVSKFNGVTFAHFNVQDGLAHGYVNDIYVDRKGDIWFATYEGVSVLHDTTTTKVKPSGKSTTISQIFRFYQNYPNPFNQQTMIQYELTDKKMIELTIYNLEGEEVSKLVNELKYPGFHQVIWDGTDNQRKEVSSGIYIAVLISSNFRQSIKVSLIH